MGLTWSTFLIEIVNFVVLVWLLTRFLYQPVQRVISSRQKMIADQVDRAREMQSRCEALTKQYENRLSEWQTERASLKAGFERELGEERSRREGALRASLQSERERAEASRNAREQETEQAMKRRAAQDAAAFCARLLSRIASPQLETALVDAAIADLNGLSEAERAHLRASLNGATEAVVATRYPLDETRRTKILEGLARSLDSTVGARFAQSDDLVAGLRIDLGTLRLEGNLAGELLWFAHVTGA
jgi:F-type H+-transporting ATPase subunit b